jgi:hypothetical protein
MDLQFLVHGANGAPNAKVVQILTTMVGRPSANRLANGVKNLADVWKHGVINSPKKLKSGGTTWASGPVVPVQVDVQADQPQALVAKERQEYFRLEKLVPQRDQA